MTDLALDTTWPSPLRLAAQEAVLRVTNPGVPLQLAERALIRQSEVYADPGFVAGEPVDLKPLSVHREVWGVIRVYMGGADRTYFRGAPIIVEQWAGVEPFGDGPAAITLPAMTPYEQLAAAGELWWTRHGTPVELYRCTTDGQPVELLWAGFVSTHEPELDESNAGVSLALTGGLFQADLAKNRTPIAVESIDVGQAIPQALNGVVLRRYSTIVEGTTGIRTKKRGSGDQSPLGYAQELLGLATTADGGQWTIGRVPNGPRQYGLFLKDRTTEHWSVLTGQRGVSIRLTREYADSVNAVWGRGIDEGGRRWGNWKFPNLGFDTAPAYPNNSASNTITVGETDASTDSGTGVTTMLNRLRELGYAVALDGRYDSSDAQAIRDVQRRYGIQVDGIVGPQTWTAMFEVGSGAGDLSGAYRAPLAILPPVEPYLYAADGAITGQNPAFDPAYMRVERDINFGAGVSKAQGIESAQRLIAREQLPGWVGSIVLRADPPEGSRFSMREGQNIVVRQWGGGGAPDSRVLLHIAAVRHSPDSTELTVDERARDLPTLGEVIARDKSNLDDPNRRPGPVNRRSTQQVDTVVEFDSESSAGYVPRHAMLGGLWNVLRIPVSQLGRLAKVEYTTESPARAFVLALFGAPITAADLVRLVGNPTTGTNPFGRTAAAADELDNVYGFIEAFGGPGQLAGYWPGTSTGTLTGRLVDTGGVDYVSARPPWVWVAEYAAASCFASGRLYPEALI